MDRERIPAKVRLMRFGMRTTATGLAGGWPWEPFSTRRRHGRKELLANNSSVLANIRAKKAKHGRQHISAIPNHSRSIITNRTTDSRFGKVFSASARGSGSIPPESLGIPRIPAGRLRGLRLSRGQLTSAIPVGRHRLHSATPHSVETLRPAPTVLPGPTETTPALDEVGIPPGDRAFRPDVQGLRALAVTLVVLYHAGVPKITGGFVGVDVFFVISGYVITGLLLRERSSTTGTSMVTFYARRARRILPAATIVIVGTTIATFHYLGFVSGAQEASDASAAGLFVANFHFIHLGTGYQSAQAVPSPLQHFWSLAVEEQFYLVYPAAFILIARSVSRARFEIKLMICLSATVSASFAWSVLQTSTNGNAAYFSPFTRAWELALGALVAVIAPSFRHRVIGYPAAALTWLGLAAILFAAVRFNNGTAFPGAAAAVPVIGTAVVIAAGTSVPKLGAEALLHIRPLQWLGTVSYGLYLIHWPILTISAGEAAGVQSVGQKLLLMALALGLSVILYRLIEKPIRHSRFLHRRPAVSLTLIPLCVGVIIAVTAFEEYQNYLPIHIL